MLPGALPGRDRYRGHRCQGRGHRRHLRVCPRGCREGGGPGAFPKAEAHRLRRARVRELQEIIFRGICRKGWPGNIRQVYAPLMVHVCKCDFVNRIASSRNNVNMSTVPPRCLHRCLQTQIAIFLAGISLAGMAGLDEFKEVSENLPNPLIDTGVVGVAFYLWVEEVSLFVRVQPYGPARFSRSFCCNVSRLLPICKEVDLLLFQSQVERPKETLPHSANVNHEVDR